MEVKTWPAMALIEMIISDNKSLKDLQEDFSSFFPYLKIEFFSASHKALKASPKSQLLNANQKIGDVRKKRDEGKLALTGDLTVADFEAAMWEKFGLSIQVFRQSGKLWIETSLTDSWTLERQNSEGYELSDKSA